MVIQMILGEVGEHRCIKIAPIHSMLVQAVGRDLHDDMGDSCKFHVVHGFLQAHRIRGGDGVVNGGARISDIYRTDDAAGDAAGLVNLFQKPGNAGFSVGSGNAHKHQIL